MAIHYIPIEYYKTKFYQKENHSKQFQEMTEEQLDRITKLLYKKEEYFKTDNRGRQLSKIDYYQRVLEYLANPLIRDEIETYDERLAFLIMAVDPNLIAYKEFLKINLQSIEEICKVENIKERDYLFEERNRILTEYETIVRNNLGFFDAKLLKYEGKFFNKFFSQKELITEVGQNNESNIVGLTKFLSSFNSITDKRYQELIEKAELWLANVSETNKMKIATYSITKQKSLIGLNSLAEQLAFFILVVDPNLDILRIYEEESMTPKTKERILETFGYYHPSLISLEQKYHSRFCPNKKISIWSETK